MNILSIDVGIKNLACCIICTDYSNNTFDKFNIIKWDVLNLCKVKNENLLCFFDNCKRKVYFKCINGINYCNIHSKKSNYIIPTNQNNINVIKKYKILELKKYCVEKCINIDNNDKKKDIIQKIKIFHNKQYLVKIINEKVNNYTLIDIGRNLVSQLDTLLYNITIHKILIENQIGPLAIKMKTIQGMLAQYFIMNNIYDIHFINASNKLKLFNGNKSTYKDRKKMGIDITKNIIKSHPLLFNQYFDIFNKHKKKDDLADCFLQGYWYINK